MNTVTEKSEFSVAACKWADEAIKAVASEESAIDFDVETVMVVATLLNNEDLLQKEYDEGTDPGKGEEPFNIKVMIGRLNALNVPRTRAAEIIAGLGLQTPGEAVMMAVMLKRLYELQDPKPERLTAIHIENFLSGGTLNQDFCGKLWDKQKGYALGLECDNLLDRITATDLEN